METNPGFKITLPLLTKAMQAVVYGDLFMRVLYATRPYEAKAGSANALHEKWKAICIKSLQKHSLSMAEFNRNIRGIIHDFDELPRRDVQKPRVGIVGEILVKFSPLANNHVVELLEAEGAEAVMPDLLDFLLYCFYNSNFKADNLGGKRSTAHLCNMGISLLEYFRRTCRRELERSTHFLPPARIQDLASMAKHYVSLGNQTGEGWFLTGEMLDSQRHDEHHLHPAVRLPAEPHRRKRRHQGTARQPSGGEYHRRRLRSGCQRSQSAEPYQTDAFHRTEEPARKENGVKNWMILN